jgi:hypothetical protein
MTASTSDFGQFDSRAKTLTAFAFGSVFSLVIDTRIERDEQPFFTEPVDNLLSVWISIIAPQT